MDEGEIVYEVGMFWLYNNFDLFYYDNWIDNLSGFGMMDVFIGCMDREFFFCIIKDVFLEIVFFEFDFRVVCMDV